MARGRKRQVLVPNPFYSEDMERRERQREIMSGYRFPATPQFIWVDEESPTHILLSEPRIAQGQTYYGTLLDKDQKRWRRQTDAAKHITVEFYGLHQGSFQTVEDKVVIPVLEQRGLRKKKKKT